VKWSKPQHGRLLVLRGLRGTSFLTFSYEGDMTNEASKQETGTVMFKMRRETKPRAAAILTLTLTDGRRRGLSVRQSEEARFIGHPQGTCWDHHVSIEGFQKRRGGFRVVVTFPSVSSTLGCIRFTGTSCLFHENILVQRRSVP
jgi:hypothetical protein